MTTDAQTQGIPRVPTGVLAAADAKVAVAPESAAEDAGTESVQELYEAGLAKLDALHDRWTAAVAELREAQPSGERQQAAA